MYFHRISTVFLQISHGFSMLFVLPETHFRQDYAARVRNLPLMDGTEPVEEELKRRLEDATGQKVVGVSVPRPCD